MSENKYELKRIKLPIWFLIDLLSKSFDMPIVKEDVILKIEDDYLIIEIKNNE